MKNDLVIPYLPFKKLNELTMIIRGSAEYYGYFERVDCVQPEMTKAEKNYSDRQYYEAYMIALSLYLRVRRVSMIIFE